MTSTCDLLVVGAGPTGLTLALQATMMGAHVRVVDRLAQPRVWAPALAIHARTLEVLRGLGVADELLTRGLSRVDLDIHIDGALVEGTLADLHLPTTEYPFVFFAPQAEVEATLRHRLATFGVEVEWSNTFDRFECREDGLDCRVDADGEARLISTRYLAGCDGADSAVRTKTGIPFRGRDYRESILLADVGPTDDLVGRAAHAYMRPGGILFFFPLRSGRWRLIGPGSNGDTPAEVGTLVDTHTRGAVTVTDIDWVKIVRPRHRLAQSYRQGRVFLAGDAAHVHSPAGAQGMNTGIQDAANLGWKLALALQGAPDALLDTYEAERRPVAKQVVRLTGLAFALEVSEFAPLRWGRRWAALPVARLLLTHRRALSVLARITSGLDTRYRHGALGEVRGFHRGFQPGRRLPDERVEDGVVGRLHRLIDARRFNLVLFDDDFAISSVDRVSAAYPSTLVTHMVASFTARRSRLAWVLVRPDGYVAVSGEDDSLVEVERYLRMWLGPQLAAARSTS